MRIYKNRDFHKWAAREGLEDSDLLTAVREIDQGLVDARLGGNLLKKRVALTGRGKRGGARTLVAYKSGDKAFFIYGFAKNVKANIKANELKALKLYATTLFGYGDRELAIATKAGALIEIEVKTDE